MLNFNQIECMIISRAPPLESPLLTACIAGTPSMFVELRGDCYGVSLHLQPNDWTKKKIKKRIKGAED